MTESPERLGQLTTKLTLGLGKGILGSDGGGEGDGSSDAGATDFRAADSSSPSSDMGEVMWVGEYSSLAVTRGVGSWSPGIAGSNISSGSGMSISGKRSMARSRTGPCS